MALASSFSSLTNSSTLSAGISFTPALAGGKPKEETEVNASAAIASCTFKGFVRAAMIPRMFGIRGSAIPFWQLTTTGAKVIVFSNNVDGKAIAPRLSVRLKAGLVSGAVALPETSNGFCCEEECFFR